MYIYYIDLLETHVTYTFICDAKTKLVGHKSSVKARKCFLMY